MNHVSWSWRDQGRVEAMRRGGYRSCCANDTRAAAPAAYEVGEFFNVKSRGSELWKTLGPRPARRCAAFLFLQTYGAFPKTRYWAAPSLHVAGPSPFISMISALNPNAPASGQPARATGRTGATRLASAIPFFPESTTLSLRGRAPQTPSEILERHRVLKGARKNTDVDLLPGPHGKSANTVTAFCPSNKPNTAMEPRGKNRAGAPWKCVSAADHRAISLTYGGHEGTS